MSVIRVRSRDRRRGRLGGKRHGRTRTSDYLEILVSSLTGARIQRMGQEEENALRKACHELNKLPKSLPRRIAARERQTARDRGAGAEQPKETSRDLKPGTPRFVGAGCPRT